MTEERHPCGHTDEDHHEQMQYMLRQLYAGDISVLVPRLSNENLELVGQAFALEVVIRSETVQKARANWDNFARMIENVYLTDSAEESVLPDFWNDADTMRQRFSHYIESSKFEKETLEGLRKLFEEGLNEGH